MRQYRISFNGTQGQPLDYQAAYLAWQRAAQVIEDRGGIAVLERRAVFDFDNSDDTQMFIDGLVNAAGFIRIRTRVICPWDVFAQVEG